MNTSILSLVSLMLVGLASGTYRRGRHMQQQNFRPAPGHDRLVQSRVSSHHGINTGPEVRVSGGRGVDHVDTEIRQVPHGDHAHTVTRKVAHVYSGNNMMQAGGQSNGYNLYGADYTRGGAGYIRDGSGYTRDGSGYNMGGSGYNRGGSGYNRGATGYNRGATGYTRGGSGYNRGGDPYYNNGYYQDPVMYG